MKWATRGNANVDRVVCPLLIRRFVDPGAEFLFVPRDDVLPAAAREGAHSFDASVAEYTHRDGLCSFEVLIEAFGLGEDAALARFAPVVYAADVSQDLRTSAKGAGLAAIAHGFAIVHGTDDHPRIELEAPMYDALYARCREQAANG